MNSFSVDTDSNENANLQCASVRLNSAKFKVHAAKYVTLTPEAPTVAFPVGGVVGNYFSTWRKRSWTLPYNFSVRMPVGQSRRGLQFANVQNDQKYHLMANPTNIGGTAGPTLHSTVRTACDNFS